MISGGGVLLLRGGREGKREGEKWKGREGVGRGRGKEGKGAGKEDPLDLLPLKFPSYTPLYHKLCIGP